MDVPQHYLDQFKEALRSQDMRLTRQRLAVLQDMFSGKGHRGCEDIYLALKHKGVRVSRATIYRTLDTLETISFVRKMDVGEGGARYENRLTQEHHDHLICVECGAILEFVNQEIERLQDILSQKLGFKLTGHVHQLYGICRKCQAESADD